jgi:hypothetical protein
MFLNKDMSEIVGCQYCACTGYEDYPHNSKPCRVLGHKEKWYDDFLPNYASSASAISFFGNK